MIEILVHVIEFKQFSKLFPYFAMSKCYVSIFLFQSLGQIKSVAVYNFTSILFSELLEVPNIRVKIIEFLCGSPRNPGKELEFQS